MFNISNNNLIKLTANFLFSFFLQWFWFKWFKSFVYLYSPIHEHYLFLDFLINIELKWKRYFSDSIHSIFYLSSFDCWRKKKLWFFCAYVSTVVFYGILQSFLYLFCCWCRFLHKNAHDLALFFHLTYLRKKNVEWICVLFQANFWNSKKEKTKKEKSIVVVLLVVFVLLFYCYICKYVEKSIPE